MAVQERVRAAQKESDARLKRWQEERAQRDAALRAEQAAQQSAQVESALASQELTSWPRDVTDRAPPAEPSSDEVRTLGHCASYAVSMWADFSGVDVRCGTGPASVCTAQRNARQVQASEEMLRQATADVARARTAAASTLTEWRSDEASIQQAGGRLKAAQSRAADEEARLQSWHEQVRSSMHHVAILFV